MAFGWKELAVTVLVAGAMAVAFFIVIPLVVVKQFEETFSNAFLFNLVEGLIRIAIFILYIVGISLIPDLRGCSSITGPSTRSSMPMNPAVGRTRSGPAATRPFTHAAERGSCFW